MSKIRQDQRPAEDPTYLLPAFQEAPSAAISRGSAVRQADPVGAAEPETAIRMLPAPAGPALFVPSTPPASVPPSA
ncbi:MAG: hypothetical protein FGM52_17255 [Mycobacterium sp.]|nr:hypothetical protein [Mycobacterium sp.]